MREFSITFLENAKIAAKSLQGSLYEQYYNIPYSAIAKFSSTADLDVLCEAAGGKKSGERRMR